MTRTENLQLPVWEAADRIMMADFNDMTAKIDAAVGVNTAELAKRGNCQLYVTSYTASTGDVVLDFPQKPELVIIHSQDSRRTAVLPNGTTSVILHNSEITNLKWEGNTLTIPLNGGGIMNFRPTNGNGRYLVAALLRMD